MVKLPIFSWLIMLYQWTRFSHTYVVFQTSNILNDDTVFQSSKGMVNAMSYTVFKKENFPIDEYIFEISTDTYNTILNELHGTMGTKYGTMQNVGILYVDFMKLFGKRVRNPWKKGYNCSELVYIHVLRHLYPDLDEDPDLITPEDVYNIVKSRQLTTISKEEKERN